MLIAVVAAAAVSSMRRHVESNAVTSDVPRMIRRWHEESSPDLLGENVPQCAVKDSMLHVGAIRHEWIDHLVDAEGSYAPSCCSKHFSAVTPEVSIVRQKRTDLFIFSLFTFSMEG